MQPKVLKTVFPMSCENYILIDNKEDLSLLVELLGRAEDNEVISLDTEFVRTTTYYQVLCCVQLAYKGRVYIVDPLHLDISSLIRVLHDCAALIITFAGSEDWECLSREFSKAGLKRELPRNIGDVQLLAAFCNHSWSRGLGFMVQDLLGIELKKDQTLSNWEHRPLTCEQLSYAAFDVCYLEKMHEILKSRVNDRIYQYYLDEVKQKALIFCANEDEQSFYRRIPGAGTLTGDDLRLLKFFCAARLRYAREHNLALNRLCPQSFILELITKRPGSKRALASLGLRHATIKHFGDIILDFLDKGQQAVDNTAVLPPYDAVTRVPGYGVFISKLRSVIEEQCKKAHIEPKILSSKKLINFTLTALNEGREAGLLAGWKKELLKIDKEFFRSWAAGATINT